MGRVLRGGVVGLTMLVAGTQMLGPQVHLFGQGMIGAGIATLYLSVFAAHSMFDPSLIDDKTTLALMIAVTCIRRLYRRSLQFVWWRAGNPRRF